MPDTKIVLDTSAVMASIRQERGGDQVHKSATLADHNIFLHQQNAAEILYQVRRTAGLRAFMSQHPHLVAPNGNMDLTGLVFDAKAGEKATDLVLEQLEEVGFRIVSDADHPLVWRRASALKSKYRRLSLADCFGVALAIELNATFWTCDRHELEVLDHAGVAKFHFLR